MHGVGKEPDLQPVTGEELHHRTANTDDGAYLDIVAEDFWWGARVFDIRVFNPFALSYRNILLDQCYCRNESEKKRAYEEHVMEIEHGSFTPLENVFSTAGGMGKMAQCNWLHFSLKSTIACTAEQYIGSDAGLDSR